MNEKHDNFDAAKLMKRKSRHCGYIYCPLCGKSLSEKEVEGRMRMTCGDQSCGFIFYQNPIPAAGAIIVENDRLLLVQRAHPPRIGWWCFPAGFMEWGEHPRETAVREVKEETGLDIKLGDFFKVYSGSDDPRTYAILMLYLAEVVDGQMTPADDALDVRFFSFDDLPEKIAFESHIQAIADYNKRYRQNK